MLKYYIDTCVWRDYYENRFDKLGKPLGKYAANLFMKIIKSKNKIIFSESLIWELKKDYEEKEIYGMLNFLNAIKILVKIEITKEEYLEAKGLSQKRSIPFIDCLQAIQARNHKAVMVSQDNHFFQSLSDITKPIRPEEVI